MKSFIKLVLLFLLIYNTSFSQNKEEYSTSGGSFSMVTDKGNLIITPWTANIIRVSLFDLSEEEVTDGVALQPSDVIFSKYEDEKIIRLSTDSLFLEIDKQTFQINYFNSHNQSITIHKGFFKNPDYAGFQFSLKENEMIFGGGEGAIPINRVGYRLNLNNEPHWGYGWGEENLNYSVPHFISSSTYSVYFDNGAIGYADIGKSERNILEIASRGGGNSYFFLYNSTQKELQKSFSKLVGNQPMPPRWAMGNMMSRFGYQTEKETRDKVDSMLIAGYPVDAVIIDLYWFGLGPKEWMMGDLDWYYPNWPTPGKMISDFKIKGVQTILITEPYILETSKNFADGDKLGYFAKDSTGNTNIIEDFWFGRAGLIDLFDPKACDWFWQFYRKQVELGVAGWWGDLGEPEKFHDDLIFTAGNGPDVKNLYGHYWSKMLSDKYQQFYPEKRLFHLNRAGFAGSQRYSSYPWSGDVSRTWGGFKAQLPNMLSMSLSNVPYAHSDLGGFCAEPVNEELYLRWLQFGVFNPIFRPHSEKVPSEPIYYSDSLQKLVRPFFELRYKLLPYNYTLAWRQEQFGEPLAAPLFLKAEMPKKLWGIFDEYFWGDAFLVAPVLEKSQTEKEIFLPNGVWFDFFTDQRYFGNSFFNKKIEYETIPVFVKAGSFIPMTSPMINTEKYDPVKIDLHFYYDKTIEFSEYILYDDDGYTRDSFKKGKYETIVIKFSQKDGVLKFQLHNIGGDFKGRVNERIISLVIHNIPVDYNMDELTIEDGNAICLLKLKKNQSINFEIHKIH